MSAAKKNRLSADETMHPTPQDDAKMYALQEALHNDNIREMIAKHSDFGSLSVLASVDTAFALTVDDARKDQAKIFVEDMAYLYMLRDVVSIVKQLNFCQALRMPNVQLYGITALQYLMSTPLSEKHDEHEDHESLAAHEALREWRERIATFIKAGGVEVLVRNTTVHPSNPKLQIASCRVLLSIWNIWHARHALHVAEDAIWRFMKIGGLAALLTTMTACPRDAELQRNGLSVLYYLQSRREDMRACWSEQQSGWAVNIVVEMLRVHPENLEIIGSAVKFLGRVVSFPTSAYRTGPKRVIVSLEPSCNAALAQLTKQGTVRIIMDACERFTQNKDRFTLLKDFLRIITSFVQTQQGIQEIATSQCVSYVMQVLHAVTNQRFVCFDVLVLFIRWTQNEVMATYLIQTDLVYHIVQSALKTPNNHLAQENLIEIIRNISTHRNLIAHVAGPGVLSFVKYCIETPGLHARSRVELACETLKNIAMFEVSQPAGPHWIQNGGGLDALQKMTRPERAAEEFQEARMDCSITTECLWQIPSYRNALRAMELPRESLFSRMVARLGYS